MICANPRKSDFHNKENNKGQRLARPNLPLNTCATEASICCHGIRDHFGAIAWPKSNIWTNRRWQKSSSTPPGRHTGAPGAVGLIAGPGESLQTAWPDQWPLAVAGAFDVNVFIKRIKVYRQSTNSQISDRVLRIKFEDLVLDYTKTSEIIYRFLNIDPSMHVRRLQSFDPEKSLMNIGLWQKYEDQKSIKLIEEAFF